MRFGIVCFQAKVCIGVWPLVVLQQASLGLTSGLIRPLSFQRVMGSKDNVCQGRNENPRSVCQMSGLALREGLEQTRRLPRISDLVGRLLAEFVV